MATVQALASGEKRRLDDSATPVEPDEPEIKRRAQNRAAQRAFRERKEKYLKDLETRLSELEVESRSWRSTNSALRSQLSLLEEELFRYRQYARANAANISNTQRSKNSPPVTARSPNAIITPPSGVPGPGEEFCDQLSMACGTSDQPVPPHGDGNAKSVAPSYAPLKISSEASSWQLPSNLFGIREKPRPADAGLPQNRRFNMPTMSQTQAPTPGSSSVSPFGSASSPGVSPNTKQSSFSSPDEPLQGLPSLDLQDVSAGFGVFDPLDDMLGWDSAFPDSVDPIPLSDLETTSNTAFTNSALTTSEIQNSQPPLPPTDSSKTPPIPLVHTSQPVHTTATQEEEVPVVKAKFMTCSDVWDRICAHPRFGEIDLNNVCYELRTMAKCSDTGVVMTESDLERVLQKYN